MERDLRKEYKRQKEIRLRVPFKPRSRDVGDHFSKAATLAIREGVTAETYMLACFQFCRMKEGPYINAIAGTEAEKWVKNYKQQCTRPAATLEQTPTAFVTIAQPESPQNSGDIFEQEVITEMSLIREYITDAQFSLAGAHGVTKLDPSFAEIASRGGFMPCICRPILSGLNHEVRRTFGYEVRSYLLSRRAVQEALTRLGYDVQLLWTWLQNGDPL
jgi:hypothetical protein